MSTRRMLVAVAVMLFLFIAVPSFAQLPRLACPPTTPITLTGRGGEVGASLLLLFDGRYVGGGAVKPGGWWSIPLVVAPATPAGDHLVRVEVRGTRQILSQVVCVVPGAGAIVPTATPTPGTCDPSYPDVCIAPGPPDLDCPEVPYTNIRVTGDDPHGLDADHDGIGCED